MSTLRIEIKSTVLSSLVMLVSGTVYLFSIYGPQLCAKFGFTQTETSFVAFSAPLGVYLSGPCVGKWVEQSMYPRRIFLAASLMVFTGYFILAQLMRSSQTISFIVPSFFFSIMGVGCSLGYHAALYTNIKNFSVESRGLSVGIPVAAFGLSSYLFSILSGFFIDGDSFDIPNFLIFVSGVGLIFNLVAAIWLKYDEEPNEYHQIRNSQDLVQNAYSTQPIIILSANMACLCGVGLMYIGNVGTIIKVFKGSVDLQRMHVGLISICNFLGRLLSGTVSDWTLSRFQTRRALWLYASGITMAVGCLTSLSISSLSNLTLMSILIGLSYGSVWTILPTIVAELVGPRKFAHTWGWMTMSPALGGELFSLIFGANFDAKKDYCDGMSCFNPAFVVASIAILLLLVFISRI